MLFDQLNSSMNSDWDLLGSGRPTKIYTANKCCHTKSKVKGLCETKLYDNEREKS